MKNVGIFLLESIVGILILVLIIHQTQFASNTAIIDDRFISTDQFDKTFELEEVTQEVLELPTDSGSSKTVIIYMVSADSYQRLVMAYEPTSDEVVELPVDKSVQTIYYSFPEWITVRAVTCCDSSDVVQAAYYEIPTSKKEGVVGGSPSRRIFKQDIDSKASKDLEFIIYNAFEADEVDADSSIFGKYLFKLLL